MNSVTNWPGLCEKERFLRTVKSFSQFPYFQFSTMEETERKTKWRPYKCVFKVWSTDN